MFKIVCYKAPRLAYYVYRLVSPFMDKRLRSKARRPLLGSLRSCSTLLLPGRRSASFSQLLLPVVASRRLSSLSLPGCCNNTLLPPSFIVTFQRQIIFAFTPEELLSVVDPTVLPADMGGLAPLYDGEAAFRHFVDKRLPPGGRPPWAAATATGAAP